MIPWTKVAMRLVSTAAIAAAAYNAHAASYVSDPGTSNLDFTGVQAGADFKGTFRKFATMVDFAPDAPASAHIEVQIELGSIDTKDHDRDQTIRGADIFDAAHFPTANYVTHSVTKTAAGFSASGALTLHGVTKEVPITFRFTQDGANAKLDGTASLKRLDFGVGHGDWKSTEWIADAVRIAFSLALKPKP